MNIFFYLITLFFMLVCNSNHCMQYVPMYDWKADLLACHQYRHTTDADKYQETINFILEYAVDRYEEKGGIRLSDKQRAIVKAKFLKDRLGI